MFAKTEIEIMPDFLDETTTHPASPLYMLFSTDGILSAFHMMNMRNTASFMTRVEPISTDGCRKGKGKKIYWNLNYLMVIIMIKVKHPVEFSGQK